MIKEIAMEILKSASKVVFILLALTACGGFLNGVLGEDNFMVLAVAAFSFYFSFKGNGKKEYAGK